MQANARILPLVSVAMCTYNGALFINEQLESLLRQTYINLEIVISDDGSTDHTVDIIKQFQQKDPRIKLFQNLKNLGYNKNFEKAFTLCRGNYIAIADQDDIWEHHKIEQMMKAWPGNALFIYSLSGSFTNNHFTERKPAPHVLYTAVDDIHKLVFNSPVHGHACMFKKELLSMCTPFPEAVFYDWWMSMHAAAEGTIACIPKTLTWHRVHENNSSRNITAIKDKAQRDEMLRQQSVYFIETFCSRNMAKPKQNSSLLQYASILKKMDGQSFCMAMFKYVIKKRKLIFHYKKSNPFIAISYVKHAISMAFRGLL